MKLFSEKVEPTFTNSSFNVLQIENFSEIFFDVYEIELNKIKYPAEKISSFRGNPVISVPVVIGEKEQEFPFVLIKGTPSILFNENNIDAPVDDSIENQDDVDVIFENVDLERESRIKEETKRELMEHIEIAKQNAQKYAEELRIQKIKEANLEIRKKNKILKESLSTAKQELVNEFVSITKSIKRELINDAHEKYSEIEETIDNKIEDLAHRLSESIEEDFQNSSKEFETNIKAFVKSIHNESVLPELRKSLEDIAKSSVSKIKDIEFNLEQKLHDKADVSVIQELSSELDALRNTNVELHNNLNKGVNKALSRIGNVNNRIDEVSDNIITQLDEKISNTADSISNYYSEKLKSLEDQTFDINEKSRKYFIDLVRESRDNLISEIRKIQKEAPVELVIEASGKKKTKSLDAIEKDIDKKISDKLSDEVVKLRKYIAVYSSGGGTVAQQFADGGVMNGNLTIVGAISANQYLGISTLTGDYLPLSGGTITGNLSVTGSTSVDNITFDQTPELAGGVGVLRWNDEDGTLDLGLKGGNVTLQIGQEQVVRAVNKTNSNLLESEYKVVRIRSTAEGGAQGQRLAIVLAQANNDPNSVDTIGLVTENIADNQEGFVTTSGLVRNIDTTGTLQGETWVDGDVLYLSPTVSGQLTKVKPEAPNHTVIVGFVVYAHQNNGKIFVKVDNGYELDELHNVKITSVSANDILKYNATNRVWENSNSISLSSLSANRIFTNQLDALSANITVIDIKQYELSGFNVQGDATVQGSISASGNLSASAIYANNKPVVVSEDISEIVQLTQAEYDAITPNASTFYIITNSDQYGPVIYPIRAVNGNYTITERDYTINITSASVITLPTAVGAGGRVYVIKNSALGTSTLSTAVGETIDNQSSIIMNTQYQSFTIQSTNSNWIII